MQANREKYSNARLYKVMDELIPDAQGMSSMCACMHARVCKKFFGTFYLRISLRGSYVRTAIYTSGSTHNTNS